MVIGETQTNGSETPEESTGLNPNVILQAFLTADKYEAVRAHLNSKPQELQAITAWFMCKFAFDALSLPQVEQDSFETISSSDVQTPSGDQLLNLIRGNANTIQSTVYDRVLASSDKSHTFFDSLGFLQTITAEHIADFTHATTVNNPISNNAI